MANISRFNSISYYIAEFKSNTFMNTLGWNDLNNVVNSDGFPLCATIIVATIDNMHIRRKYELDIYTRKSQEHCSTLVAKWSRTYAILIFYNELWDIWTNEHTTFHVYIHCKLSYYVYKKGINIKIFVARSPMKEEKF